MEDNLIAQAALFVWRILSDLWEIYIIPFNKLTEAISVPSELNLLALIVYIIFTATIVRWGYLKKELVRVVSSKRRRHIVDAIDESFEPDNGIDNRHLNSNDYRLQYLELLQSIDSNQKEIIRLTSKLTSDSKRYTDT